MGKVMAPNTLTFCFGGGLFIGEVVLRQIGTVLLRGWLVLSIRCLFSLNVVTERRNPCLKSNTVLGQSGSFIPNLRTTLVFSLVWGRRWRLGRW